MKIAVTGASGHVGANLCRTLIDRGYQVKTLIHQDDKALQGLDIERINGSLSNPHSLEKLFEDVEIAFHLAAMISVDGEKDRLVEVNVEGTRNVLDAVEKKKVRRLLHFSSIHALKHIPYEEHMDESRPLVESSPMMYEVTKSRGEKLVMERIGQGLDAIIFNPTAIIGPYDFKPSLMGQAILRIYKRSLPALVPGGYDWVDVRDICHAAVNAIDQGKTGERYIFSGKWVSVRDLASKISEITGRKVNRLMIPTSVARIGVPFVKAYARLTAQHPLYTNESLTILKQVNKKISHKKAADELGFTARPIEESLKDSIEWFRQNGFLK